MTSKRLITLFLVLLATPASLLASSTAVTLDEVLWWLPERSESLIVAQAFTAPDLDSPSAKKLQEMLEAFAIGPLGFLRDEEIYKRLIGQRIVLSVTASRRFRLPSGIGAMPYDGCDILVTENDDVRSIIEAITASNAISSFDLEGNKVLVFKKRFEQDDWTFYVTAPRTNVLLVTTDKESLTEVMERMKTRARTRVFDENLSEWRYIDRSASFWGLRHYRSDMASKDPSSPLSPILGLIDNRDPNAIGFLFSYRPGAQSEVEMMYLSTNMRSAELVRSLWTQPVAKLEPIVVPLPKVGARFSLAMGGEADPGYFMLLLMMTLGQGVLL